MYMVCEYWILLYTCIHTYAYDMIWKRDIPRNRSNEITSPHPFAFCPQLRLSHHYQRNHLARLHFAPFTLHLAPIRRDTAITHYPLHVWTFVGNHASQFVARQQCMHTFFFFFPSRFNTYLLPFLIPPSYIYIYTCRDGHRINKTRLIVVFGNLAGVCS